MNMIYSCRVKGAQKALKRPCISVQASGMLHNPCLESGCDHAEDGWVLLLSPPLSCSHGHRAFVPGFVPAPH